LESVDGTFSGRQRRIEIQSLRIGEKRFLVPVEAVTKVAEGRRKGVDFALYRPPVVLSEYFV
jgi:hypothetical protein